MSDYPPTPSFDQGWTNKTATYHDMMGRSQHSYNDPTQEVPPSLDYNISRSHAAFQQNSNVPSFTATMGSGVPPLPIYQSWGNNTYTQPSMIHDKSSYPSNTTSTPGIYINSNLPLQVAPSRLNPTPSASRTPVVEEGELSEGEFNDIYSNKNGIATPSIIPTPYENTQHLDGYHNNYHQSEPSEYMNIDGDEKPLTGSHTFIHSSYSMC
jgi:hypothetical protein